MRRRTFAALILLALAGLVPTQPAASQDDPLLRQAVASFFRDARVLRLDAVPDLYEGGYARVTIYAARAALTGGFRVDEAWVRLVGASFNPQALRRGQFQLDGVRDTALHLRVTFDSLELFFSQLTPGQRVRLWSERGWVYGRGVVPLWGAQLPMDLRGVFVVNGGPELYFRVDRLRVNGLPVPEAVVKELERRFNPVVTQKDWPVRFNLRAVVVNADDVVVSSDPQAACRVCADFAPAPRGP
ncbi:MAG: LmeA family phospholipid-binding protein [Armatimonadota bacterium]|nr:LmeA family phospholipid-binding protein [Armatimonadota bacterium]MDW8155205.1 LmeA family phospholipid-binding protein [Armatimonadota bacterium]